MTDLNTLPTSFFTYEEKGPNVVLLWRSFSLSNIACEVGVKQCMIFGLETGDWRIRNSRQSAISACLANTLSASKVTAVI